MLLANEIIEGAIYAWDTSVTEPAVGCNLFTIEKDTGTECGRLTVRSIDGEKVMTCGEHCLVPVERALRRLEVLDNAQKEQSVSTLKEYSFKQEQKYLEMFQDAYTKYMNELEEANESAESELEDVPVMYSMNE